MLAGMKSEIDQFLRSGDYDPLMANWPGVNSLDRIVRGEDALRDALLAEVRRREAQVTIPTPTVIADYDLPSFSRAKLAPMVCGLFPRVEQEPVLMLLERSVVFLTPENIELSIRQAGLLSTARQIANVYLVGIGAATLGDDMRGVLGASVETTCYVSLEYFAEQYELDDYVVHEAAHVFHNVKRRTAGLPETKRQEWLLPIAFEKREMFAFACERYSRILELCKRPADRRRMVENLPQRPLIPKEYGEPQELRQILTEAVNRRNGWKAILQRCAPEPRRR
jgi:hypothetical protein